MCVIWFVYCNVGVTAGDFPHRIAQFAHKHPFHHCYSPTIHTQARSAVVSCQQWNSSSSTRSRRSARTPSARQPGTSSWSSTRAPSWTGRGSECRYVCCVCCVLVGVFCVRIVFECLIEPASQSAPCCCDDILFEFYPTHVLFHRIRTVSQENADEIPAGSMPRCVDVICRNEVVEMAKAGAYVY